MKLNSLIKNIKSKFSDQVFFDENLSNYSWFNLGGPAKIIFKPKNLHELSFFLQEIKGFKKIKVLGVGSNTLIRDGGFNGIIIKFGKSFSHLSMLNENTIVAGASALDKSVSNFALENSVSGLEFLSCIPGSVGGAIRMNAGCYNYDISTCIVSIQALDLNGIVRSIKAENIKFSYRNCDLPNNLIFLSATFKGDKKDKKKIKEKMDKFVLDKKKSQPSKIKTCGSTFKNPLNLTKKKAWELVKAAKCENMKVGDASISEKHSNFFVNQGSATSSDMENLINKVKERVFEVTGIKLELELKIIGEKK